MVKRDAKPKDPENLIFKPAAGMLGAMVKKQNAACVLLPFSPIAERKRKRPPSTCGACGDVGHRRNSPSCHKRPASKKLPVGVRRRASKRAEVASGRLGLAVLVNFLRTFVEHVTGSAALYWPTRFLLSVVLGGVCVVAWTVGRT